jgi:spermidine synthase
MLENGWFYERSFKGKFSMGWKIKKILHSEQSPFQKIDVLETEAVGRLLLLDGKTMVSDLDEFVYHEVMAHIPYMVTEKCEKVLIIGGGDGGVVREFARHAEIKQIDLVEIDQRVIEVSKKFFPNCTSALDDPRVNIFPEDGFAFIKNKKNEYDIIIIDSTDPEDFASGLFTQEFYLDVFQALTENGIMMNQTENPFLDEYDIKNIYTNMKKSFPFVQSFTAPMSIYPGVFWTFGFSSKKYIATNLVPEKRQYMSGLEQKLKWYNMQWHQAAFSLSNFHKQKIGL